MTQTQTPAAPAAKKVETIDVSLRYKRDDSGATVTVRTSERWRALLKRLCEARQAVRHNMAAANGNRAFTYAAVAGMGVSGMLDAAAFAVAGPDGDPTGEVLTVPITQPLTSQDVRDYMERIRESVSRLVSAHLQPIDMTVSVRTVATPVATEGVLS